jgi:hypothetical protein
MLYFAGRAAVLSSDKVSLELIFLFLLGFASSIKEAGTKPASEEGSRNHRC